MRENPAFHAANPATADRIAKKAQRYRDDVGGFRVVHAPGHTSGHVIFFRESDRIAIAGDVVFNVSFLTGTTGLREPPAFFSIDKAQNRRSMRLLADLKPKIVCFGHGPPLYDTVRLDEFVAEREVQLAAAVNAAPV